MNNTYFIGRLVNDPELKETDSGKKVLNVTVAVPKINGKEISGDFNDIISKNGLSRDEALKNIQKSLQPALKLEQEKSKSISSEKTNNIKKENKERVLSR